MFIRSLLFTAILGVGALAVGTLPAQAYTDASNATFEPLTATEEPSAAPAQVSAPAPAQVPTQVPGEPTAEFAIVKGQVTAEDKYPEMVQVLIPTPKGRRQICTGTIINAQWVLTAAHCFDGIDDDVKPGVYTYFNKDDQGQPVLKEFASEGMIVHPWYRLKTVYEPFLGVEYDVALVRMAEWLATDDGSPLPTANLMTLNDPIPTQGRAIVAGRGTYQFRYHPRHPRGGKYLIDPLTPRDAEVPIRRCGNDLMVCVNDDLRPETFPGVPTARRLHDDTHRQPSSCYGDSGGPLFVYEGNVRRQVGIASHWRVDKALEDFYHHDICGRARVWYTSVAFMHAWIQHQMDVDSRPGQEPPTFELYAPPYGGTAFARPQR